MRIPGSIVKLHETAYDDAIADEGDIHERNHSYDGVRSRFVAAGYKDLKPFIKIMDIPIIEWIVKRMYPSDVQFVFVCRGEHLSKDAAMRERLLKLAPNAMIVSIEDWVKKGRYTMYCGRTGCCVRNIRLTRRKAVSLITATSI